MRALPFICILWVCFSPVASGDCTNDATKITAPPSHAPTPVYEKKAISERNFQRVVETLSAHFPLHHIQYHASGGVGLIFRVTGPDGKTFIAKVPRPEVERLLVSDYTRIFDTASSLDPTLFVRPEQYFPRERHLFRSSSVPVLTYPYLSGGSVEDQLSHLGPKLSEIELLELLQRLVAPIRELHRKGLVHNDIKPNNFFVEMNEGKVREVKLGDLDTLTPLHTEKEFVLFSPHYIKIRPSETDEQVAKRLSYSAMQNDLDALQRTLQEVVLGRKVSSLDPQHLYTRKFSQTNVSDLITPPHQIDSRIPESVSHLVMREYGSAQDWMHAIFTALLAARHHPPQQ